MGGAQCTTGLKPYNSLGEYGQERWRAPPRPSPKQKQHNYGFIGSVRVPAAEMCHAEQRAVHAPVVIQCLLAHHMAPAAPPLPSAPRRRNPPPRHTHAAVGGRGGFGGS